MRKIKPIKYRKYPDYLYTKLETKFLWFPVTIISFEKKETRWLEKATIFYSYESLDCDPCSTNKGWKPIRFEG